jgi:hypothetical protein
MITAKDEAFILAHHDFTPERRCYDELIALRVAFKEVCQNVNYPTTCAQELLYELKR